MVLRGGPACTSRLTADAPRGIVFYMLTWLLLELRSPGNRAEHLIFHTRTVVRGRQFGGERHVPVPPRKGADGWSNGTVRPGSYQPRLSAPAPPTQTVAASASARRSLGGRIDRKIPTTLIDTCIVEGRIKPGSAIPFSELKSASHFPLAGTEGLIEEYVKTKTLANIPVEITLGLRLPLNHGTCCARSSAKMRLPVCSV
jgi:hypothetical protein